MCDIMNSLIYNQVLWGAVRVSVYGGVINWDFSGDTPEKMEERNPDITHYLGMVVNAHEMRRVFAPIPIGGGNVVEANQFKEPFYVGRQGAFRIFRGLEADGVLLDVPTDACFFSTADYPITVLYNHDKHRAAVLHCSLRSMVPIDTLLGGRDTGPWGDIIEMGIMSLNEYGRDRLSGLIAAGVGPELYIHPPVVNDKYRALIGYLMIEYNRHPRFPNAVVHGERFGTIDLRQLIRAKLTRHQILDSAIEHDGHDIAGDRFHNGGFMFHSRHRDCGSLARNLVVVKLL